MKVVLLNRVLNRWRTPVYRRLARWPGIEFVAIHGADFPGTKTVNASDRSGFDHVQVPTWRLISRITDEREITLPLFPTLLFRLWSEAPDVVLAEGGVNLLNNALLLVYATLTRTPVVWWTLGEVRHPGPLSPVQRLFRTVVAAMDRCGAAVLGYSSQALRYFDRIGIPAERQFRALNCVDTDQVLEETVRVRDRVEPLREELGLAGRRVVLFVGALAPYKRVEDLIAVYADLRRAHGDLALLIVGGGSHRTALERCARAEAAEDVVFSGEVLDGVAAYFELGSVFVLPGLGGLAISEAMCHGLPVISPEADGTERDLIEDGKSGFLVTRGDRAQLRERLEQLLSDPDRARRMGERSRWLIEHRYNIGTFMESLVGALVYAHGDDRRPGDAVESGPAAR